MIFEKATTNDIEQLTDLRDAYIQEDLGDVETADAAKEKVSVIELKSTDEGYRLYQSVGFEDVVSKYHVMRVRL